MNSLHSKITTYKEICHRVRDNGKEQRTPDSWILNNEIMRQIYLTCWEKLEGSMQIWARWKDENKTARKSEKEPT